MGGEDLCRLEDTEAEDEDEEGLFVGRSWESVADGPS